MITIILNRYGKKESMEISPCYEKVLLTLWKLGLDRDPEKYTLKELGATFTYETPEEHQMVRIINADDTLTDALLALMRMRDQPELILESIEPAIQKGRCSSIACCFPSPKMWSWIWVSWPSGGSALTIPLVAHGFQTMCRFTLEDFNRQCRYPNSRNRPAR